VTPTSAIEIAEFKSAHHTRAEKVPGHDLPGLNRVLEYSPEDMTVTVQSGITLAALQTELARHRQWLPVDPPRAHETTVHDLLAHDLNGPRRFGYGTVREHLLGLRVALADGRIIRSGGKVVKNVAGYDLAKLFIGAHGSLGVILEATFKLRPLSEAERFLGRTFDASSDAVRTLHEVMNSECTPVILDLHRGDGETSTSLVLGFAGTEQEVEWQVNVVRGLGLNESVSLDYEKGFWSVAAPAHGISVLPSRLADVIATLGPRAFIARAGNGVVHYRGEPLREESSAPGKLMRAIKSAYDPKNILPEWNHERRCA
jgi:FAD/FMN-containing dehydrogenase